jgi:hypothetical protein
VLRVNAILPGMTLRNAEPVAVDAVGLRKELISLTLLYWSPVASAEMEQIAL